MRILRITSISVFLLSMLISASGINILQTQKVYPARSYVMISTTTSVSPDGVPRVRGMRTRWVTAANEWKEVVTSIQPDGKTLSRTTFSKPEGAYAVDEKTNSLQYIGATSKHGDKFRSTEFMYQREGFVRKDVLLGFETFVYRIPSNTGTPNEYIDVHYAPEIGSVPVKTVMHAPDGRETIVEAIRIDFVEITNEMLAKPNLPVRFDFLQAKIDQYEKRGFQESADQLRKLMREWQEMNQQK